MTLTNLGTFQRFTILQMLNLEFTIIYWSFHKIQFKKTWKAGSCEIALDLLDTPPQKVGCKGFTLRHPHVQRNQSILMILLMEEILHQLYGHNATHHHLILCGIFTRLTGAEFCQSTVHHKTVILWVSLQISHILD